jgi:hypothetical protein
LSGVAAGHRDFAVLGPRIKRSKSGARDEPLPHQRLKFHVLRVCSAALTFLLTVFLWSSSEDVFHMQWAYQWALYCSQVMQARLSWPLNLV